MGEQDALIENQKKGKEITLTEQNWRFLKHLRLGATLPEAYKLAGYEGEGMNSPYALYHQIKKKLEEVVKADGFDKLRLALDFQKVLSLPLADSKAEVTLTEWLKIRRLAHTIMSDNEQKSPQSSFTMIVIETGGTPTSSLVDQAKVIDAQMVDDTGEQASNEKIT